MNKTTDGLAERLEKSIGSFFKQIACKRRKGNLKPIEYGVLSALYWFHNHGEQEVLPSKMSSHMGEHHPAVTPVLNSLEEGGYICRRHSSTDRRKVYVSLTPKGISFTNEMLAARRQEISDLVDFLGDEESIALVQTLEKILSYYKNQNDNGGSAD